MSDIDIMTHIGNGFQLSIGDSPQEVYGNRLLMNIFEITFLTAKKYFIYNGMEVVDGYGGDADNLVNRNSVLSDVNSLSASMIVAINETVKSMQSDEKDDTPPTEKILNAELMNLQIDGDTVYANIRIYPAEVELGSSLEWRLPIIKRE